MKNFCENACFITDEEYSKLRPNSELYTGDASLKVEDAAAVDDAQLFYDVYSKNQPASVNETGVQTSFQQDNSVDVAVGTPRDSAEQMAATEVEKQDGEGEGEMQMTGEQSAPIVAEETGEVTEEMKAKQVAATERLNMIGGPMKIDSNNPDIFKIGGVPTLFYTKTRDTPTLVMLTIDYEMQVIYLSRNDINRFFPVKLISRLVTNTAIIAEEFEKQIEADKGIKLDNTIVLNAANFTDSVAIQFPDPILKDRFIEDLKQLKNEIRAQNQ
ncbi:Mg2+ and Co2+ transporter, putative [Babesia ovata]|uniref:Mg2+ and Co2+ transporter, putative n=1 Tax=Babesia ovata TaxID=189622 RepID=A0A2H6KJC1_9APIC|nr:Mg2+ and Co2+ transporter, putative [Babesia ovata]GBE63081.1 Mg2+ and Co2+ transporter, putative [Babesia ovata]